MNKATDAKNATADMSSEPVYEPKTYGVEAYTSKDYIALERDRLWRKVWLQAGRVEEIPNVGDYITFDILDDSILIVRTAADKIKAFHNVCQHRGRRLVDTPKGGNTACGKTKQFVCGFHGWRWNLEGENIYVLDKDDWKGALTDERIKLKEVKLDTWGGWVWINMDPNCEPLRDFLEPAASMLDPFHLENMRFSWRRWAVFNCNWKVAMEAFNETYHVQETHPEFTVFGNYTGWGRPAGDKHAYLGYDAPKENAENAARLRLGKGKDPRISTAEMQIYTWEQTKTTTTLTMVEAAKRLVHELPEGTPPGDVMKHWITSARADDAKRGVEWPTIDPQHNAKAGTAWQIFPNFRIGHAPNNMLCYNGRPYGNDPDKCIFEVSVFELYPKGQEPKAQWEYTDPEDLATWGSVLPQDFGNMEAVQQGMKSLGFAGPRPNPKQEGCVTLLHESLARYMDTNGPTPLK
jgi:phenylpropionate dioxygenase-like ring-hydroxylating dioxygenase large terminal subunit